MRPGKKISSFTRQEVAELFACARAKIKLPGLRILKAPTTHPYGRILIVIPRKVGTAPERNLIRRRIKMIFREKKLYLYGSNFIALIGPECKKISFQELERIFSSLIKGSVPSFSAE